ncbi:MAG: GIY-YIG nuclease family protein [Chloroflexi bacterium]|nr:GIY-YIG nuclease family protein [Chloroflexota bacterium]
MPDRRANPAGGYVLLLHLEHAERIQVGRLGAFDFPPAHYLYFGSALGGLASRIQRHQSTQKRLHWHIDYLTATARVEQAWWAAGRERWECLWAQTALEVPGISLPAAGFGSSDCRCPSHLVQAPSFRAALSLRCRLPGNPKIWRPEDAD